MDREPVPIEIANGPTSQIGTGISTESRCKKAGLATDSGTESKEGATGETVPAGLVSLDWLDHDGLGAAAAADLPIVLVIPGLTGDSSVKTQLDEGVGQSMLDNHRREKYMSVEDGGRLVLDDGLYRATLTVPPGALRKTATVSIRQVSKAHVRYPVRRKALPRVLTGGDDSMLAAFDKACDRCSPVYELLPHLEFGEDSGVTLAIEAVDGDARHFEGAAALRSSDGTDCELVDKSSRESDGKAATITLRTFSSYWWSKWVVRLQVLHPKTKTSDSAADHGIFTGLCPTSLQT